MAPAGTAPISPARFGLIALPLLACQLLQALPGCWRLAGRLLACPPFPNRMSFPSRTAARRLAVAALLLAAILPTARSAKVPGSTKPPGGLQPSEVPQFILWS